MPLFTEPWYRDHMGSAPRKYHDRIPLPTAECFNHAKVDHEVNYIWHPRHDDKYWQAVQEMRGSAPPEAADHYEATTDVLNRTRRALGRPDFCSPASRPACRRHCYDISVADIARALAGALSGRCPPLLGQWA